MSASRIPRLVHVALTCALMTTGVVVAVPAAAAPSSGITSRLRNFDGVGTGVSNQVARFDTSGNGIDAEEGEIDEFADPAHGNAKVFVLYGESHGCGFQWSTAGTPFCGFNAYTSTDLVHWDHRGKLFDPEGTLGPAASIANSHSPDTSWQSLCDGAHTGCFRPHVVYNAARAEFVLWFYSASPRQYYVLTSPSPYRDFVLSADGPHVDPSDVQGDHYLFVDPASTSTPKSAYIAHAYWGGPSPETITIDVQQLNSSYDGVVGPSYPTYAWATDSTEWDRGVEAPAMFARNVNGTTVYYLTYSDPHCGYGMGCGTAYMWALSPTGPWGPGPVNVASPPVPPVQPGPDGKRAYQTGTMLNSTSCGGQPTAVSTYTQRDGSTGYLFQSNLNTARGTANQGTANFYWAPLRFDSAGSPQPFACDAISTVSLRYGLAPPRSISYHPRRDQSSVAGMFQADDCTIGAPPGKPGYPRAEFAQIVTAGQTGLLRSVSVTVFAVGTSRLAEWNAPLTVSIVPVSGTGPSARPTADPPLVTTDFQPAPYAPNEPQPGRVGWSMRTLTWTLPPDTPVSVTAGTSFGIRLSSTAPIVGCYGMAVSPAAVTNPYVGGQLLTRVATDWMPLATADGSGRSLRFTTIVESKVRTTRLSSEAVDHPVVARRPQVAASGSPGDSIRSPTTNRYDAPATSAPTIGASQNSQSWPSAQPCCMIAGPVERAGFTDVFDTGIDTRWMITSVKPIATPANPAGARTSVDPMIT